MGFPRLIRSSTSLVLLTGVGIVVGSAAFTAPPLFLSPVQANDLKCEKFLKTGADPQYTHTTAGIILYRTRAFFEHISSVTARKKWIGAVKVPADNTSPFPGLSKDQRGCLYFRGWPDQGNARHAVLYDSTQANPVHTYTGKWLCIVTEHESDATPSWEAVPNDCRSYTVWLWTTRGPIMEEMRQDQATPTQGLSPDRFLAQVRRRLEKEKVPRAEAEKFLATMRGPGPWYPCAQTGCCRAFE